jgi:hypothetical protein
MINIALGADDQGYLICIGGSLVTLVIFLVTN